MKYFPSSKTKKLAGYLSQAIGIMKLPLLVHEDIHDIYKDHPSAPAWTYTTNNVNDTASFEKAFERMVAEIRMTEKQ